MTDVSDKEMDELRGMIEQMELLSVGPLVASRLRYLHENTAAAINMGSVSLADGAVAVSRLISSLRQAREAPPDLSDWVGEGKRYATVADMARDAMRWHDEAQAEKMGASTLRVELAEARELPTAASADPVGLEASLFDRCEAFLARAKARSTYGQADHGQPMRWADPDEQGAHRS